MRVGVGGARAGEVDWRAYAATKGLTEKQQKLVDKIRKREARVQNLQREIDKIKVVPRFFVWDFGGSGGQVVVGGAGCWPPGCSGFALKLLFLPWRCTEAPVSATAVY